MQLPVDKAFSLATGGRENQTYMLSYIEDGATFTEKALRALECAEDYEMSLLLPDGYFESRAVVYSNLAVLHDARHG